MSKKDEVTTRDAKWGERMIEIKLRFWTDDIAEGKGKIQPKHAWAAGVVRIGRNKVHDITPQNPVPFNSLMDLSAKIEKVLMQHGITLHLGRRMEKYLAE